MSRPPFERKPTIGIIVPIVAIAAAITIGALTKGNRNGQRSWNGGIGSSTPPGTGISLASSETGIGPAGPASNSSGRSPKAELMRKCAGWARFDFAGTAGNILGFQSALRTSVQDTNGKQWPHDEAWEGKSLYVLIPSGYASPPNSLKVTTVLRDKEFAATTIASLPPPKKVPPPKTVPAWKGLVIESVRLLSDSSDERRVFIESPINEGEILAARVLATDFTETPDSAEMAIKGPEPGKYLQAMSVTTRYPQAAKYAFVEVSHYSKQHVHRRLKFKGLPYIEKFGSVWIAGVSAPAFLSDSVELSMMGHDLLPFRTGMNARSRVPIYLAGEGLLRHVKTTLVRPLTIRSLPIELRSMTYSSGDVRYPEGGPDWKSGPLDIEVDIEADVYPLTRRAIVNVGLSSPRTIIDPVGDIRSPYNLRARAFSNFNPF